MRRGEEEKGRGKEGRRERRPKPQYDTTAQERRIHQPLRQQRLPVELSEDRVAADLDEAAGSGAAAYALDGVALQAFSYTLNI